MKFKRRIQRKINTINKTFETIDTMRREVLYKPFAVFVPLMAYMTEDTVKSLVLIPPPKVFCKVTIPDTLQQATFGTLVQLQQAPKDNDYLKSCCALVSVLTGVDARIVASRRAYDVLGIVNMVQGEMERIGRLFQSLNTDKSSDEQAAGIDRLNFGAFGIVDWYAQRMGIVDHEDVFNTPWQRIYQCAKIDHENNEFEKRYRKIIEQRSKRK